MLLLGGGHAHLGVLRDWAAQRVPGVDVTMVTPYPRQIYSGMVPGVVAGHYTLDDASIPLAPLAARAGVTLLQARATGLEAGARTVQVRLANGTLRNLEYDALSIDTGPVMHRDRLPGARERALFVRPIERFVQMLERLDEQAAQQPLRLAVIGGGAGGLELALAFAHRLAQPEAAPEDRAAITLITGDAAAPSGFSRRVQQQAAQALERAGVTVVRDEVAAVAPGALELASGGTIDCDLPVVAVGAEAPGWLAGGGLQLDAQGFVQTGITLQSVSHPNVFAAGDVATRIDAPRPRNGVYAVRAGPPLALNLRRWLCGAPLESYVPQTRSLALLSLGRQRAIAAWGGWSLTGDALWRWKDGIDRRFVKRHRVALPAGQLS